MILFRFSLFFLSDIQVSFQRDHKMISLWLSSDLGEPGHLQKTPKIALHFSGSTTLHVLEYAYTELKSIYYRAGSQVGQW